MVEEAETIGELYGEALSNFDDFGDFQLALTNAMTYRSYDWSKDQFKTVLERFVEAEVSCQSPTRNEKYKELKQQGRKEL